MGPVPNCAHCGALVAIGARQCPGCGVTLSGRDHATLPGRGHAPEPSVEDAMIGRSIIGQFEVKAKLGEGGMGSVYLADQPTVGRTAVIKVIHPWLSKDPGISARFDAEARAAARLQNPHIVSIYNYGKLPDGTLFLAMEHIKGSTLAQTMVSRGRIEPSRAVNIGAQCCEALAEAHRHGVIHRDVKPSNIMVAERQGPGFVKMVDFGVATIDAREAASPGRLPAGTPCYMSPEQLAGQAVDGRSDIYSLAVVIYEMLVGQPPFLASTPEQYARKHREVPPPAPSAIAPEVDVPPALEACLMRALAKEPHARPLSAERFADELWSSIMATPTMGTPTQSFTIPPPRRRRTMLVAGLMVALAVVGVGAAALVRHSAQTLPAAAPSDARESAEPPPTAASATTSPARAVLMARSVVELEAELERVAVLRGRGSKAVMEAMTAYYERARAVPPGSDTETHRRHVLVGLILDWAREPSHAPSHSSIAELEAVFLRMNSPLGLQERRDMLREAKDVDGALPSSIRARLLSWIDTHGLDYETGDPGAEMVLEDEPSTTD